MSALAARSPGRYISWIERNDYKTPDTFEMIAYVIVSGGVSYIIICAVSAYISFRVLGGLKNSDTYLRNEFELATKRNCNISKPNVS